MKVLQTSEGCLKRDAALEHKACGRSIFLRPGSPGLASKITEHLVKFEIQINTHFIFFAHVCPSNCKEYTFTKQVFIHSLSEI